MRYSYATVSLPTLNPQEACAALRSAGFTGVEWRVGQAPHAGTTNADQFLLGNRCTLDETVVAAAEGGRIARAHDLEVVGLSPYIQSGDVEALELAVDMAIAAGTTKIRIQAPRQGVDGPSYRSLFAQFRGFLQDGAARAGRRGVRLALEMHHYTIAPSVGLTLPLLEGIDSDTVGVIYDVGNMVYEGFEDYRIGIELLGPYLQHVHLKNASAARDQSGVWRYQWARLDDGLVDVKRVLQLLDDSGYDQWVSIEDLSIADDSRAAITFNARVLDQIDAPGWGAPPTRGNPVMNHVPTSRTLTLPDSGVDGVIAALHNHDTALPEFVYERLDPQTRNPLTTWIGLHAQPATATRGGADGFRLLNKQVEAAGPESLLLGVVNYPDDASDSTPYGSLVLTATQYLTIDHTSGVMRLVTTASGETTAVDELVGVLTDAAVSSPLRATPEESLFQWTSTPSRAEFSEGVEQLRTDAGDQEIDGVVLSVRMNSALRSDPVASYRALRDINPSTCMFLVRDDALSLWGATSLSMAQIADREVVAETDGATHPIPDAPDGQPYVWVPSAKERSEYDAVASALHEDLLGIAEPGSVRFARDAEERRFFGLGHLFAELRAEIAGGQDEVSVLEALYPHGAAVGHPRGAALAAIARIERFPRGPFAGMVVVVENGDTWDAAAITRFMWTTPDGSYAQAGAKVVPASVADEEYTESVLKTLAVRQSAHALEVGAP